MWKLFRIDKFEVCLFGTFLTLSQFDMRYEIATEKEATKLKKNLGNFDNPPDESKILEFERIMNVSRDINMKSLGDAKFY